MGILEKLMETDAQKLMKRNKKGYEVKRLSELLGEPFVVELRPVTVAEIDSAQEMSKGVVDMRAMVVLQAATVEGKRLTDKSFLEKFGTPSGREVVEKLFMPGEIETMFNIVNRLSGYGNVIKEVKNS